MLKMSAQSELLSALVVKGSTVGGAATTLSPKYSDFVNQKIRSPIRTYGTYFRVAPKSLLHRYKNLVLMSLSENQVLMPL
jgi:hypothetical protein